MPMRIIAVDANTSLDGERARVQGAAAARSHSVVSSFASLAALVPAIQALLAANNFDCMTLLEIDAHGSPSGVDHLRRPAVAAFGTQLRTINLCDEVDIYLSGCNTAVNHRGMSVAQALSIVTPTRAADNIKVTVWGTVGYMSGTHMEGNEETSESVTLNGVYYGRFPDAGDGVRPGVQIGSMNARNGACWRAFLEGNRVV